MMRSFFRYFKRSFELEVKRLAAYRGSFMVAFIILPLWTVLQLLYVETLFKQTGSFVGYGKYEAYLFFGAYRILQGSSNLLFVKRIFELKYLIRGEGNETFDQSVLKPIDSQLYSSFGRMNLTGIVHILVGLGLTIYAISHLTLDLTLLRVISYIYTLFLGYVLWYITFLFVRSLNFWFEELDSTDSLHRETMALGRNPTRIYQGIWGILINVAVPITLLGAIPADILLGNVSPILLVLYTGVIFVLFLLVRQFWQISVRKYSSFSS